MSLLDSKLNTLLNMPNRSRSTPARPCNLAPPPPPQPSLIPVQTRQLKETTKGSANIDNNSGGMSSVLEELSSFKRNVIDSYMSPRASYLSKKCSDKIPLIIDGVVTRNKSRKIAIEKAGEEAKKRISRAYLPKTGSPLRKVSVFNGNHEKENSSIMEKVQQKFNFANGTPYRKLFH